MKIINIFLLAMLVLFAGCSGENFEKVPF